MAETTLWKPLSIPCKEHECFVLSTVQSAYGLTDERTDSINLPTKVLLRITRSLEDVGLVSVVGGDVHCCYDLHTLKDLKTYIKIALEHVQSVSEKRKARYIPSEKLLRGVVGPQVIVHEDMVIPLALEKHHVTNALATEFRDYSVTIKPKHPRGSASTPSSPTLTRRRRSSAAESSRPKLNKERAGRPLKREERSSTSKHKVFDDAVIEEQEGKPEGSGGRHLYDGETWLKYDEVFWAHLSLLLDIDISHLKPDNDEVEYEYEELDHPDLLHWAALYLNSRGRSKIAPFTDLTDQFFATARRLEQQAKSNAQSPADTLLLSMQATKDTFEASRSLKHRERLLGRYESSDEALASIQRWIERDRRMLNSDSASANAANESGAGQDSRPDDPQTSKGGDGQPHSREVRDKDRLMTVDVMVGLQQRRFLERQQRAQRHRRYSDARKPDHSKITSQFEDEGGTRWSRPRYRMSFPEKIASIAASIVRSISPVLTRKSLASSRSSKSSSRSSTASSASSQPPSSPVSYKANRRPTVPIERDSRHFSYQARSDHPRPTAHPRAPYVSTPSEEDITEESEG